MTYLLTGGTGFIGAEIARRLAATVDDEIYVLHRSGNFERLADIAGRFHFIAADLADTERLAALVDEIRPRFIYHLGAMLTGPGENDPQTAIQTNAFGTYALIEAARRCAVEQFLFASSIGTYGADISDPVISDLTVQRPLTAYGVTKVFAENLGAYYRQKYGFDFRGLRYPSIIGPGVKTASVLQFTSWVIEESSRGNPYTIAATPETVTPIMYYKDAAQAMIQLAAAPPANIKRANYLIDGPQPSPTAGSLADMVRARIPGARIDFAPNPAVQPMLDRLLRPLDDSQARADWGWQPGYDLAAIIDDFLAEMSSA